MLNTPCDSSQGISKPVIRKFLESSSRTWQFLMYTVAFKQLPQYYVTLKEKHKLSQCVTYFSHRSRNVYTHEKRTQLTDLDTEKKSAAACLSPLINTTNYQATNHVLFLVESLLQSHTGKNVITWPILCEFKSNFFLKKLLTAQRLVKVKLFLCLTKHHTTKIGEWRYSSKHS
jgi:hypothetical protein